MLNSKNGSFPKIALLKQLNKKNQNAYNNLLNKFNFTSKELKSIRAALVRRDLIIDEETQEVLINIGDCAKNKELDKSKLIQLIRNACKFNNRVSIYGWNKLMINLDIQYGSRECLNLVETLKDFIIKHGNAYLEETERAGFFQIVKASESILSHASDNLIIRHPEEETSSYFGMWVALDETYYIMDEFYEALLNYGYTKEQIKVAIHTSTMSGKNEAIPLYLRKRYLVNPDGTKSVRRILLDKE